MKEGLDQVSVVHHYAARGAPYRAPGLLGLRRHTPVDLVPGIVGDVEPLRFPAAPVLEGEGPGHDGLRIERRDLVLPPGAQLRPDDGGDVALEPHPIDELQPGAGPDHVDPAAVAPAVGG